MVKLWFKLLGTHDDNALSVAIDDGPTSSSLEDIDVSDLLTKNLPLLFDVGGRMPSMLRLYCPKPSDKWQQGRSEDSPFEDITFPQVATVDQLDTFYDRLSNQMTIDEVVKTLPSKRSILVLQLLDPPATPHLLGFTALDSSGAEGGSKPLLAPTSRHSSIGDKGKVASSLVPTARSKITKASSAAGHPKTSSPDETTPAVRKDKAVASKTVSKDIAGTGPSGGRPATTSSSGIRHASPMATRPHTASPLRRSTTNTTTPATSEPPSTSTRRTPVARSHSKPTGITKAVTAPPAPIIAPTITPPDSGNVSTSTAAGHHTPRRLAEGSRAGMLPPLAEASPTRIIEGVPSDSDGKEERITDTVENNALATNDINAEEGPKDTPPLENKLDETEIRQPDKFDTSSEAPQGSPRRSSVSKDKKLSINSKPSIPTSTSATGTTKKYATSTVSNPPLSRQSSLQTATVASSAGVPHAPSNNAPAPRIHISQQHLEGVCDIFKPQWAKATCATCGHAKLAHQLKERESKRAKKEQPTPSHPAEADVSKADASLELPSNATSPSPQRASTLPRVARTPRTTSGGTHFEGKENTSGEHTSEKKTSTAALQKPAQRASPLPTRPTTSATGTAVRTSTSAAPPTGSRNSTPQRRPPAVAAASPLASSARRSTVAASPAKGTARIATPTRGTPAAAMSPASKPPTGKTLPTTTPRRGASKDLPVKVPTAKSTPPPLAPKESPTSDPHINTSIDEDGGSEADTHPSSIPRGEQETQHAAEVSGHATSSTMLDMPSDDTHSGRNSSALHSTGHPPLSARRVNSCLQRHIETRAASALRSGTGSRTASPSLGRNRSPVRGDMGSGNAIGGKDNSQTVQDITPHTGRSPIRGDSVEETTQAIATPNKQAVGEIGPVSTSDVASLLNIPAALRPEEEAALADRARPIQLQPMEGSIGSGGTTSTKGDTFNLLDQPLGTPRVGLRSPSHFASTVASPDDKKFEDAQPPESPDEPQSPKETEKALVADYGAEESALPKQEDTAPLKNNIIEAQTAPTPAFAASSASLPSRNGVRHAHSISDIDSLAATHNHPTETAIEAVTQYNQQDSRADQGDTTAEATEDLSVAQADHQPVETSEAVPAFPSSELGPSPIAVTDTAASPIDRTNTIDLEILHQQELAVLDAETQRLMAEAASVQGLRDHLAAMSPSGSRSRRDSHHGEDIIEVEDNAAAPTLPAQSQQLSKQPSETIIDQEVGPTSQVEVSGIETDLPVADAPTESVTAPPAIASLASEPDAPVSKAVTDVFDDFFNGAAPSQPSHTGSLPPPEIVPQESVADDGTQHTKPNQHASPDMFVSKTSTEVEIKAEEEDPFDTLYDDVETDKNKDAISTATNTALSPSMPLPPLHPQSPRSPLDEGNTGVTLEVPSSPPTDGVTSTHNAPLSRAGSGTRLSRHSSSGGLNASGGARSGSTSSRNKRWGAASEHLQSMENGSAEAGGFFASPLPDPSSPKATEGVTQNGAIYEEF